MVPFEIKQFIRSPGGSVLIGIVSALILGSFATAGINTLWLARTMITASAVVVASYVLTSSATSQWAAWRKALVIAILLATHIMIERVQTWAQPAPPKVIGIPMPPLLLMLPPLGQGYAHPEVKVPGLPLSVSYLDHPSGGVAGFGRLGDTDNDDVMLGIPGVRMRNLSDHPLRLSWSLEVVGENKRFLLRGDGKGRWERQLNVNDYCAKKCSSLSWLLSPTVLPPKGARVFGESIGFVAPDADEEVRQLMLSRPFPDEYTVALTFRDEETRKSAVLRLPFGEKPRPANDRLSRALRAATGSE